MSVYAHFELDFRQLNAMFSHKYTFIWLKAVSVHTSLDITITATVTRIIIAQILLGLKKQARTQLQICTQKGNE